MAFKVNDSVYIKNGSHEGEHGIVENISDTHGNLRLRLTNGQCISIYPDDIELTVEDIDEEPENDQEEPKNGLFGKPENIYIAIVFGVFVVAMIFGFTYDSKPQAAPIKTKSTIEVLQEKIVNLESTKLKEYQIQEGAMKIKNGSVFRVKQIDQNIADLKLQIYSVINK